MLKKIINILKKIVLSMFLLYGYNILMQSFNLYIPINIYTVLFISVFDLTGFMGLIIFYLLNFR